LIGLGPFEGRREQTDPVGSNVVSVGVPVGSRTPRGSGCLNAENRGESSAGGAPVRLDDCAFETARLSVADWHSQIDGVETLVEAVCEMLTTDVTEQLPPSWQGPYSAERAAAWISDRDADGILLLAIRADTREPVGLLMLHEDESSAGGRIDVRIGYLVTPGQWGRGFATELLAGLIDWARVSGVASMIAGVAQSNGASIRVLEKCGLARVDGKRPGGSEYLYRMDL